MKFDFDSWIEENQHIYEAFEREALKIAQKRKRYSARTIIEFLRHHSIIKESGSEWKINDHSTPHLARMFVRNHPEYVGFFEFRRMNEK